MYNVAECPTEVFLQLGKELEHFGRTSRTRVIIEEAVAGNPWFTPADIVFAAEALRSRMLTGDTLRKWSAHWQTPAHPGMRVAVIMAGNIPFAGFADLMYVVASGHVPCIKPSSKDRVLIDYIIGRLRVLAPEIRIEDYRSGERYDAVVASGSDNTGRYLQSEFDGVPAIIRGSRSSVALIRGDETPEQLGLLSRDMFLYSGLGCRNVSMLLVPSGYDIERFGRAVAPGKEWLNPKYYNNYLTTRARLAVEGLYFVDCCSFIVTFGDNFPACLSNIVAVRYDSISEAYDWLGRNEAKLQCVVGRDIDHPRAVGFGQAQLPGPEDYPDGVNVMDFLAAL